MLKDSSLTPPYKALTDKLLALAKEKGFPVEYLKPVGKPDARVYDDRIVINFKPYSRSFLVALAHEVGHVMTNSLYYLGWDEPGYIYQCEQKAWNWATVAIYAHLTPRDRVRYQVVKRKCLESYFINLGLKKELTNA